MNKQQTCRPPGGWAGEARTRDKLLASIHKISSLLTRPISLDKIMTSIVRETCQVFGFTRLAIFFADKEKELLECRYIHGFNPDDSERALRFPSRFDRHDCVETRVARFGRTIYVREYQDDPRMTPVDLRVSRIMRRAVENQKRHHRADHGGQGRQQALPDQEGHRRLYHLCQPGQHHH